MHSLVHRRTTATVFHFIFAGALLALLSSCVTTGAPQQRSAPKRDTTTLLLNQLSRSLPGRYGNFQQVHAQGRNSEEKKIPLLNLSIQASEDLTESIDYIVEQYSPSKPDARRVFVWRLLGNNERLLLRIAPRDRAGAQACDIPLQPTANGYAGQSDPRQCAVDNAEQPQLGVRKEVAISASGITLADQVVDLLSGQVRFQTIVEFQRIVEFKGWAGLKGDDGQWRLARGFMLHNDGDQISLVDQQGRSLGIRLQLARVNYREDRPAILRLAVYREAEASQTEENESSAPQMLAYSWAEPGASQIGLNLDWFQAGLELHLPGAR